MGSERRYRVLLAEDDPAQREILQELLELEGYEVATAGDPAELVRQLDKCPDALLLDVVGMTNPSILRTLRCTPWRPAVLLVSGDQALPKLAQWVGADGFVAKPYDIHQLLDRLREAIDRRSSIRAVEQLAAGWA
jgi:two-component system response regulator CpxR